MVKIINSSYEDFMKDIRDKELFLYGAGERAKIIYKEFCLKGKVKGIIDKKEYLEKFQGDSEEIPIITIERFEQDIDITRSVVLITPTYVYMEIIEELDIKEKLTGLNCYMASLILDHYEKREFSFTRAVEQIPKKIHYCWFGGSSIPDQLKRYMESWYRFCPDFEIKQWDESNYDITVNRYMREAYECKKWGYVPDYARLDIIYKEGGIYLDTDVELLAPLDQLLNDGMFCHFVCKFEVNFGSGFGAIKGHKLLKQLRDYYENKSFYHRDGTLNVAPCTEYQDPVLEEFGFKLNNNTYQKIDDVVIYPSEVGNPKGRILAVNNFTEKTLMIHHGAGTHRTESERKSFIYGMEQLNERMKKSL